MISMEWKQFINSRKKSNTFNWTFSSPALAFTNTFKLTSKCSEMNNNKEETFWVARERGSRRAVTEREESGLSIENNLLKLDMKKR